jgi:hypothetical protein
MPKPKTIKAALGILLTPRGVCTVRIYSGPNRQHGLELYRSVLPAIEKLDRAARLARQLPSNGRSSKFCTPV